jgi:hypothetical protein
LWATSASLLAAASIATPFRVLTSLHACAVVAPLHLHAGFRAWSSVAAVSTFGPAISKRRAGKSACSHKGRCAKDGREAVANAAEA